eukprot:scaffold86926_cov66-Phaeocystis_antarctica.AAC.2
MKSPHVALPPCVCLILRPGRHDTRPSERCAVGAVSAASFSAVAQQPTLRGEVSTLYPVER